MNLNIKIAGQGFPLLCLHGHPGNSECLSVFTDRLSRRFKTYAPDLRGYGKSPALGNFEMSDHLADLKNLLDRHEIERCFVLGWSLGGILSLELALNNRDRIAGLILIATAAYPRSNHPQVTTSDLLFTGIAGIVNYFLPAWKYNIETFGKRSLFRYLIQQHNDSAYRYLATCGVPAYLQTSKAAEKALSAAIAARYNRQADLGRLGDLPSLVLAGAEDRHITSQSSLETARNLDNSTWKCYENTAHLFPWEIPDRVLKDIDLWLDSQITSIAPTKKADGVD